MSQQQPNRNFNANAQPFIPNVNAMPFVPGTQPFSNNPQQQQQYYQQMYQNYGQPMYGGNPMMYMHPGPQVPPQQMPPMGQWQQPQGQQVRPQQQQQRPHQPPQQQEKPRENPKHEPADSWDDGNDVVPEPPKPAKVASPAPAPVKEVPTPKPEPAPAKEEKPKDSKPTKEPKETPVAEVVVSKLTPANIEEIEKNHKEHLNIVFIGHVDAGKSTIGGQIMYLTGMVDKRTLEKYEREAKEKGRESWYLSWALDTNDEEREKGKTVEVGRAFFETEKKRFTILDAPGHKSFVPNMISGTTQADLAVLVISARKGEFETGFDRGGQTREHAMLAKTAGVKHLIVLVNKMDDSTVSWDEARYKEIQDKLGPYLRKCGFGKNDITFVPCSGLKGDFLKERPEGVGLWYTGPCFLELLDSMAKISRDFGGPVRMIIVDKYTDMGTIVMGKMESGVVEKGQNLLLMPNRTMVQVLQCWCDEDEVDQVVAGDSVKLKLKGVEEADILSGFVLCSQDAPCRVGRIFDAEVFILEHKSIITSGYTCVLHLHTAVEEVQIERIICRIDKKTGEKIKGVRFVKQDDKCIVRIKSEEAFCLDTFKEFAAMARFTLRDEGKTIGIGKVVKVVE